MSKIKDLKIKHPNFALNIIDDLANFDPSGTNKYLQFFVNTSNQAVTDYFSSRDYIKDTFKDLIKLVEDFDKYCQLNVIENKDIYSYTDVKEINTVVKLAVKTYTDQEIKESQTLVLFEDENRILVKPLSAKSAIQYGKNTKWCTSATEFENKFAEYASYAPLLYLIFKHQPVELPETWRKLAFNRKNEQQKVIIWDNKSDEISPFEVINMPKFIGEDIINIINEEFKYSIPNNYMEKDSVGCIKVLDEWMETKNNFGDETVNYIKLLTDKRNKKTTLAKNNLDADETENKINKYGESMEDWLDFTIKPNKGNNEYAITEDAQTSFEELDPF